MKSLRQLFFLGTAFFCLVAFVTFNTEKAAAQVKRVNKNQPKAVFVTTLEAALTDSFSDPDNDGKAKAGDEVTYTATITNTGAEDATNVTYTNEIDSKTTLVPGSVQVQSDGQRGVLRCRFYTANRGTGDCNFGSDPYSVALNSNYMVLGGHGNYLALTGSNADYDSGNQKFSFDVILQNLLPNMLGTLDGTTLDSEGVKLFINSATVTAGTGSVTVANADGTGNFTNPNQPYFLYNQILAKDQVTNARNLQFNVPTTVSSFTVDFLVYTRVQAMLVINEVMVNPIGSAATEQPLEWFEVYNAGMFPVNMQGFKINDYASTDSGNGCESSIHCARPAHTIASSVTIPGGGYFVFGANSNPAANGGAPVDYAYGTALTLGNSGDGVSIQSPDNLVIDKTLYFSAAFSAREGIARELKNPALDNLLMDSSNWDDASVISVYGQGGRGTPKSQNSTYTPAPPPESDFKSSGFGSRPVISVTRRSESADPLAGETISVNVGTIPANGTATITYKVTIANPLPAGTTQISTQGNVSGSNFTAFSTDDPDAGGASDATVTLLSLTPTAARVIVQGRVFTPAGRGLANAQVLMTDASGETRYAFTNPFGYYQFADVAVGQTVITQVISKRYRFATQAVNLTDAIADLNFVAEP